MRIGQGFDVHKFGEGDKIILGGVVIPHKRGLIAHSDGDVLLHSLCDALLGASGLGDIGQHFPDNDPQYKNADSRSLLRMVASKIQAKGWLVVNCDNTIIAQQPRMMNHIPNMEKNIAEDLSVDPSNVNVKATTTEMLGFTGREEGIAVQSIVLLKKNNNTAGSSL
ncbi:MAG: 2-C-methyl-D-erythritol 2,4-cyclodiphosphate synthase [Cellvibrionaceae bacterium]